MAVVCDDLFFARYRRSTELSQSLTRPEGRSVEEGANRVLSSIFNSCHSEDEKGHVITDLLDTRLLPATDGTGVHFNEDRINHR